jgi:carotenoid cleavage dioxygenase-like enzyme
MAQSHSQVQIQAEMHAGTPLAQRAVSWLGRQMQKRVPYAAANPYLERNFAPVAQERSETALQVSGELPPELNGLYARIGPNPIRVDNPATYHWFIGAGMVHGLRLREGRALWYRNRWVGTDSANRALGRPLLPGPRRGVFDVVNTNIIGHAGRLWALTEAGVLPAELDGELATQRHGYFNDRLSRAISAHPHRDPASGELHAVCYDAMARDRVHYVVVDPAGSVRRLVDIPVRHGPMVHDCAITASQVLVFDLPVTFSLREFLSGAGLPYHWNPRHPARVGLLPREGAAADIRWCSLDPCYVYHACNAYDLDDGGVAVDVVVHSRMFDRWRSGPEEQAVSFERWTLDPRRGSVARSVWSDRRQEFPRFDERCAGQPYRYAYTVGFGVSTEEAQPLLRHDLHTGRTLAHDYGPRKIAGEAVFVPRAADAAEDEGWLLSYVYDADSGLSDLVVLNAEDLGGTPQAVVHLPCRVPMGFHGNWIPDA